MPYCNKCGNKHEDDVQYCTKCGNTITMSSSLEKNIDKVAGEFGRKAEQIGKKSEKNADDVGKYINQWFDKSFKIAGPLIGAFIALIILRIIIYLIRASGEDIFIVTPLGEGLYEYLLIIFGSMLLSGKKGADIAYGLLTSD